MPFTISEQNMIESIFIFVVVYFDCCILLQNRQYHFKNAKILNPEFEIQFIQLHSKDSIKRSKWQIRTLTSVPNLCSLKDLTIEVSKVQIDSSYLLTVKPPRIRVKIKVKLSKYSFVIQIMDRSTKIFALTCSSMCGMICGSNCQPF